MIGELQCLGAMGGYAEVAVELWIQSFPIIQARSPYGQNSNDSRNFLAPRITPKNTNLTPTPDSVYPQ